jgi:hypothetical protein
MTKIHIFLRMAAGKNLMGGEGMCCVSVDAHNSDNYDETSAQGSTSVQNTTA